MKKSILFLSLALTCVCAMSVATAETHVVSKTKQEKPSLDMPNNVFEISSYHYDAVISTEVVVTRMSYALIEKVYPTLGKHKSFEPADVSIWTSRYQSRAECSPHMS